MVNTYRCNIYRGWTVDEPIEHQDFGNIYIYMYVLTKGRLKYHKHVTHGILSGCVHKKSLMLVPMTKLKPCININCVRRVQEEHYGFVIHNGTCF